MGLLWIDGDHSLAGTRLDVDAWLPHLMPGHIAAFHDTLDQSLGPYAVLAELLESGHFELVERCNSTAVLRKVAG